MDAKSDVQITINRELIEPIVRSKIQAAIISELEKTPGVVLRMVTEALDEKVDEKGVKGSYDSYNKYSFIERQCTMTIQNMVKGAIMQWFDKNKPQIEKTIDAEIRKRTKQLSVDLAKSLADQATSGFRFNITLSKYTERD